MRKIFPLIIIKTLPILNLYEWLQHNERSQQIATITNKPNTNIIAFSLNKNENGIFY